MKNHCLITFVSTHDAIKAEKILSKEIPVTICPTPRKITSSCGISIQISEADFSSAYSLLSRIKLFKMYKYENFEYLEIYTQKDR